MEMLKPLENKLVEVFKNAPKLPSGFKKWLAAWWPFFAILGGVLQLWAAYAIWQLTRFVGVYSDYLNAVTGRDFGPSGIQKPVMYVGIISLVVSAVILFLAYPKLVAKQKAGWDLLFLGALISVAVSVLNLFMYGRGFGGFLSSLVGTAISTYILFQMRDMYLHKAPADHTK